MSRSEAGGTPAVEVHCGHCGGELAAGGHDDCARKLALEPPRYCTQCRRRMVVQVTPLSWAATCVEHGEVTTGG